MEEKLIKKSFFKAKKEFIYYRPSQVRSIPLKTSSNHGFYPFHKPHLKGIVFEFESQLECDFICLLDHDPNCYDFQTQPIKIEYETIKAISDNNCKDPVCAFFLLKKLLNFSKNHERFHYSN